MTLGHAPVARAYCAVYHRDRSWHIDLHHGELAEIGRSRACAISLQDEKISRLHATLQWSGGSVRLQDLGSTNGTLVNGRRVEGTVHLGSGDEIGVGGAQIVIGLTSPAAASGRRVLAHADFEQRLREEAGRTLRHRRSAALLMVQLPPGSAGALVDPLVQYVRGIDSVGAYGPRDLEILLTECTGDMAVEVAERLARPFPAIRIGIAVLPAEAVDVEVLVSRARASLQATTAARRIARGAAGACRPSEPVVADPAMRATLAMVDRVASRDISVLITGETGAGKELVARELHLRSARAGGPFIAVNCAALPETIADSELFGHERGAFTGAVARKIGLFEAADHGTIFLDEVGELGSDTQARLLRVLQEREILRVGSTQPVAIDVRVVAATNRDLERQVVRGEFRQDLLFRLDAFSILVPPLRMRPRDLPPLCERFLAEAAQQAGRSGACLTDAARAAIACYPWPGNVRELRNALIRAFLLADGETIGLEHLPDRLQETTPAGLPGERLRDSIDALEEEAVRKAFEAARRNQTRAAQLLGISRRAFIYKLEKYGFKVRPRS